MTDPSGIPDSLFAYPRARRPRARKRDTRPSACKRGYDRRWRDARRLFLANHPTCAYCEAEGMGNVAADTIDHNPPHRGDRAAFWDKARWVPCCRRHNNLFGAIFDGGFGRPIKERPPAPSVRPAPVANDAGHAQDATPHAPPAMPCIGIPEPTSTSDHPTDASEAICGGSVDASARVDGSGERSRQYDAPSTVR
jgi:5-methylcytosine-specific restriction protein A